MMRFGLLLYFLQASVFVFADDFVLESPAFLPNSLIPIAYTCKGGDTPPPLVWRGVPPNSQSLALVVDDPDAPNGVWTHWIIVNLPPNMTQLESGALLPKEAIVAENSWGNARYQGPCPPLGMHRYVFHLYALDTTLPLASGTKKNVALDAMTGHVIGRAELVGLFQQ